MHRASNYKIINVCITILLKNSESNTCFLLHSHSLVGVKDLERLFIQPLKISSRGDSIGCSTLKRQAGYMYPRLAVSEMKCPMLFLPSLQLGEQRVYIAC